MVAWFAACWVRDPEVIDKIQELTTSSQILNEAMIKECTNLTRTDVVTIGKWFLQQQHGVTKSDVNSLLKRMRVRRYCIWTLLHPENELRPQRQKYVPPRFEEHWCTPFFFPQRTTK